MVSGDDGERKVAGVFRVGRAASGDADVRAWDAAQPVRGKAHAMMTLPKEFPADKLVTPKQAIFNAADGTPIHGQLFLPADMRPGEKRPALFSCTAARRGRCCSAGITCTTTRIPTA